MCIWNKVLVGLISVASIVMFYMAARALQTETSWSLRVLKDGQEIKRLSVENHELAEGTDGIRQKSLELHKLLLDRRRMWSKCDPKVKVGNATAEIAVSFDQAIPRAHGIAKGSVVYAFEETDVQKKGQYLGEFYVTAAAPKQVTVVPTGKLNPREVEKLKKSTGSWSLYDILPRDNHETFASLSDEQKKAMLPTDGVREYLKDGKPADKDDPAEFVVDGKFVRPLLDYSVLFADEYDRRLLLADSIQAVQADSQLVQESLADARTQEEACQKDIDRTLVEMKGMERERVIVANLREKLEKNLEAMQAWIAKLTETNQAMAGQIAKHQLEAARRIDQRTRTMAQSGAGRL